MQLGWEIFMQPLKRYCKNILRYDYIIRLRINLYIILCFHSIFIDMLLWHAQFCRVNQHSLYLHLTKVLYYRFSAEICCSSGFMSGSAAGIKTKQYTYAHLEFSCNICHVRVSFATNIYLKFTTTLPLYMME